MISVLSTNIVSPLGVTTDENYRAVRNGNSKLARYNDWRGIPEPFVASLFDANQRKELHIDGFTLFESIAINSIHEALSKCAIDVDSPRTLFILSTTKANVDELDNEQYTSPGASARKIANYFGLKTEPVVVCNACISGVDAQILALRLLNCGFYDNAIVCGVDVVTPFIVAGFLSFKSLSMTECRPFDIDRTGLNLGEAAATIILSNSNHATGKSKWQLCSGAMSNDAYHVSAPSPKGDGSCRALEQVLIGVNINDLALLSTHGTATMFNDQMESKAIDRMSLAELPISALKGYYGHTLGAAGVLETIITMRAMDDGIILGVRGFEEIGVSGKINISAKERTTDKHSFLKMISGFGGCNGALLYSKRTASSIDMVDRSILHTQHNVKINQQSISVDGECLHFSGTGKALLTEVYKEHIGEYPKFHKMDILSKLAVVATELLVKQNAESCEDTAVILFNRSSSIVADRKHNESIKDKDNFYPSPSLFLYTLPNIALGEIAIKFSLKGETSLYILDHRNEEVMQQVITSAMSHANISRLITGWIDCTDDDCFEADIHLIIK